MTVGSWFFFFLFSNFWIIFFSTISTWITKFKSAHMTAPSSSSRTVFSASSRLRESWGTAHSEEQLLDTADSSSPLMLSSSLFQRRPPFLSDAHSGQDHVAQGDTECIYTGSTAARKLWITVSTLFSNWVSTVTPWWGGSLFKPFQTPPCPSPNGECLGCSLTVVHILT